MPAHSAQTGSLVSPAPAPAARSSAPVADRIATPEAAGIRLPAARVRADDDSPVRSETLIEPVRSGARPGGSGAAGLSRATHGPITETPRVPEKQHLEEQDIGFA